MNFEDPNSLKWVGSWRFKQDKSYGYTPQYGGEVVESIQGEWTFLPNQTLLQGITTIQTFVVDPISGTYNLVNKESTQPFTALWSTDYNNLRPNIGYYNLAIATSFLDGAGLNLDPESGESSYYFGGRDIHWKSGYYYEFLGNDSVLAKEDPEDPYETPMQFTRLGGPGNWNSEFYDHETYYQSDLDDDGIIGDPKTSTNTKKTDPKIEFSYDQILTGNRKHNKLKAKKQSSELYGKSGNDKLIGSPYSDWLDGGPGNDKLIGKKGADIYVLSDGKDLIKGFKGSESDIFLIASDTSFTLRQAGKNTLFVHSGGQTVFKRLTEDELSAAIITDE